MASAELTMRITPTNAPSDKVTLDLSGTTVTISALEVARLFLEKIATGAAAATGSAVVRPPAIGSLWPSEGGIYAGLVRGNPDYHVIVLEEHSGEVSWTDAMTWGQRFEDQRDPIAGLPKRKEQALMFANVPELFEKAWYWSREQYDAEWAWSQRFGDGCQYYPHKDRQLRARAVRRLIL